MRKRRSSRRCAPNRKSLRAQLDNMVLVDEDGNERTLKKKDK